MTFLLAYNNKIFALNHDEISDIFLTLSNLEIENLKKTLIPDIRIRANVKYSPFNTDTFIDRLFSSTASFLFVVQPQTRL
jgi:hypothetical protein